MKDRQPARIAMETLTSLPAGWRCERLKFHVTLNEITLGEDTPPDKEITYIDISTVDQYGSIGEPTRMLFADAPTRARRVVRSGDTIVSTVRTYLKAIAHVPPEMHGFVCSTGFAVLTPSETLDDRFLYYWTRSAPFIEEVKARSVGVGYPAINAIDVVDIVIPVPMLEEQRAIADELDAEIASIDQLSALITDQLTHLEERRGALITEYTSGRLSQSTAPPEKVTP